MYLTDWFSHKIKPPVPGVYNVWNDSGQTHCKLACYWNGDYWTAWDSSNGVQEMDGQFSITKRDLKSPLYPSEWGRNVSWRGLKPEFKTLCEVRVAQLFTRCDPPFAHYSQHPDQLTLGSGPAFHVADMLRSPELQVVPFIILLDEREAA